MERRILLLVTDLEIGGTPTVVRELAVRLREPGRVHVEVACLGGWGPVAEELKGLGVHVTALGARGVWDLPRVVHGLNHLLGARLMDTCFSFLVHANAVAALAGVFKHEVRYLQSIQTTQREPGWHWTVQRMAGAAAEKMVVPSQSVKIAAEKWAGVPAGKIVVIANAVEVGEFAGVVRRKEEKYVVGFIGRLDRVKRVPDLVRAVGMMAEDVVLRVYGEGRERVTIEGVVRELGLEKRVEMKGAVGSPQEALGEMDVLVLPSEAEGFGLVLIEAMAAGVPVVGRDVPGVRDVVKDGINGVLAPAGSVEELARAIERVKEDAELRERIVEGGKRVVRERFDWEGVMREYRRVLKIEGGHGLETHAT